MTTNEEIPDTCPKCGGTVRLRTNLEPAVGGSRKEWRCAKGCLSWAAR